MFSRQQQAEAREKYFRAYFNARQFLESGDPEAAKATLQAAIDSYEGEVAPTILGDLYAELALLLKKSGNHTQADECAITAAELGSKEMQGRLDAVKIPWRRNRVTQESALIEGVQNDHIILFVCALITAIIVAGWLFSIADSVQHLIALVVLGYGFGWFSKRIATIAQVREAENFYHPDTIIKYDTEAHDYRNYIIVAMCIPVYLLFTGSVPWYEILAAVWGGFLIPNIFCAFRPVYTHITAVALAATTLLTGNMYYLIGSAALVAIRELYLTIKRS